MSYQPNRSLGFQKWGVTNPWVFANYGQPQRRRGYVSPMVVQTHGPFLKNMHLGDTAEEQLKRGERMERYALAGLAMSGLSLLFAYRFYSTKAASMRRNRRRRRTSRR